VSGELLDQRIDPCIDRGIQPPVGGVDPQKRLPPGNPMTYQIGEYSVLDESGRVAEKGYYIDLLKKVDRTWKIFRSMSIS